MEPFIPTRLYTVLGEYVTTVEMIPFKIPVQVVIWGSRTFVFNQGTQNYHEAQGICHVWTEEEKKALGIH